MPKSSPAVLVRAKKRDVVRSLNLTPRGFEFKMLHSLFFSFSFSTALHGYINDYHGKRTLFYPNEL